MAHGPQGIDRSVTLSWKDGEVIPSLEPVPCNKGRWHKITWTIGGATLPNATFATDRDPIEIFDNAGNQMPLDDKNEFHDLVLTPNKDPKTLMLKSQNTAKMRYTYFLWLKGVPTTTGLTDEAVKVQVLRPRELQTLAVGDVPPDDEVTKVDPTIDDEGF